MSMIQIRNVPEDLHRKMKARAALEGVTLSEFALNELCRAISAPSPKNCVKSLRVDKYGHTAAKLPQNLRAERDVA